MSNPSWILKKLVITIVAAYLLGGMVLMMQSYSASPEPLWVMVLAPLFLFMEPWQFIGRDPVTAVLWTVALYILISFLYDRREYHNEHLQQLQKFLRKLLSVLPVAYIAAGALLFVGSFLIASGPSKVQVLVFGPGLVVLGPAQKIMENPLVWGIVGLVWVFWFYQWLPAWWKKRKA